MNATPKANRSGVDSVFQTRPSDEKIDRSRCWNKGVGFRWCMRLLKEGEADRFPCRILFLGRGEDLGKLVQMKLAPPL
jgi:hypothetical protein